MLQRSSIFPMARYPIGPAIPSAEQKMGSRRIGRRKFHNRRAVAEDWDLRRQAAGWSKTEIDLIPLRNVGVRRKLKIDAVPIRRRVGHYGAPGVTRS